MVLFCSYQCHIQQQIDSSSSDKSAMHFVTSSIKKTADLKHTHTGFTFTLPVASEGY